MLNFVFGDEYHRNLKQRNPLKERKKSVTLRDLSPPPKVDLDKDVKMHPDPCAENTCSATKSVRINEEELDAIHWKTKAEEELQLALKLQKKERKVAKNVIVFLGDGMATASITAGRILKGQKEGKLGAEATLSMDTATHLGFSRTYNVDAQVPDSAGTATAYLTGVKTDLGVVGLTAAVTPGICEGSKGQEVKSVLMDSHDAGKATGIVTTTRLNHATPSGAYAHSAYRYWYDDSDLTEEARANGCTDIAFQLYKESPKIQVLLGGGRKYFRPKETNDEEYDTANGRTDGQDLIEKWRENMNNLNRKAEYVWNKEQFDNVDPADIDHLWGMFEPGDMEYEVDRKDNEPSLTEMTEKAIEVLKKNENGFYLLVEGGRIDHAHHGANANRAINEVHQFDRAIARAREMTSEEDTLIVVTADHGHTFTFAGYPRRGTPIFGLSGTNEDPDLALDGKPWTSMLYGNGGGWQGSPDQETMSNREEITAEIAGDVDYQPQSAVPLDSESHGGDDIPILASGPMSHLFHSVHQQSYIAHVTRYASCVGGYTELCEEQQTITENYVEFLGYSLNYQQTENALNAMFGLEIAFFASSIFSFIFVRMRLSK